jgi:hypothetical protein
VCVYFWGAGDVQARGRALRCPWASVHVHVREGRAGGACSFCAQAQTLHAAPALPAHTCTCTLR